MRATAALGPRLLLVSPREPRPDGQGDQRRAQEILDALNGEWHVDVVSWLPDADVPKRPWKHPLRLGAVFALALVRPLQVAYVQGMAGHRVRKRLTGAGYERVLYLTDRAVPLRPSGCAVIDFVDDLGGSALRRAAASTGARAAFWRWEAFRTRRLDRRLAERALIAVAHSAPDAAGIAANVRTIPLAACTKPGRAPGGRIVFVGNLFYSPNDEAAKWICAELVPCLVSRGIDPGRVLIAGRRPQASLVSAAASAGIELRANVDNLAEVLYEAAVVVAPMALGTGAQYKIIDSVGAGRPCVLTTVANAGLGLVDGASALVCDRTPEAFTLAIASLLEDPKFRQGIADAALEHLSAFMPGQVAAAWRSLLGAHDGRLVLEETAGLPIGDGPSGL